MRFVLAVASALVASVIVLSAQGPVAFAAFHCMRIHAVMAGYNGNGTIQYVELRMNTAGQTFVAGHTLQFLDGTGSVKATFTFPSAITNGNTGDSILIASPEFNAAVTGGAADYVFSASNTTTNPPGGDAAHPVQGTNGRVHFAAGTDNCDADFVAGAGEADSLTYGSPLNGLFGSPPNAADPLPSPGTLQVLRLGALGTTPSNNKTEYTLQNVSTTTFAVAPANLATDMATPRNNGRTVLKLPAAPSGPVGGISTDPQLSPDAAANSSDNGGTNWMMMLVGAGAASVVLAMGAFYARRRRSGG